jgi:competence ComEA-like helix-hairpin-helix protein
MFGDLQNGNPFVVAVGLAVLSFISFAGFCYDKYGFNQSCEIALQSRINPNDAPAASLIRLPGIGVSRAWAIVAYREEFSKKDSNNPAFRNCDDLCKVRGIGPQTAKNISEWLKFE